MPVLLRACFPKCQTEVDYTSVREPSGYDADNRWLCSAGLAYKLDPNMILSGYIDGPTAILEGNDDWRNDYLY